MKYNIGEVANLLGLTSAALHYYEKEGIIDTKKEENGHRFYTIDDVVKLLLCKEARNMDVPLKDIITAFKDEDHNSDALMRGLLKQKLQIEHIIHSQEKLLVEVDDYIRRLERIKTLEGNYNIEKCMKSVFLPCSEEGLISDDPLTREIAAEWVERMPFTKIGFRVKSDNMDTRALLGYMAGYEKAMDLRLPFSSNVVEIESSLCVHTIMKVNNLTEDLKSIYDNLEQHINRKKLVSCGEVFGVLLYSGSSKENGTSYIEAWMPVCS